MPNGIFDSILDTSSPQPNGKQDGGRFIRHIAFDMFARGLGQSGLWLAHGKVLMLVLICWPCFHWSKLWHQHNHKHKKNELVRFYCAYAYAYALVKTRLKISSCRVNTTSGWIIKQLGISLGSIFLLFSYESSRGATFVVAGAKPWPLALIRCLLYDVLQSEALPCMTASWITALISFLD